MLNILSPPRAPRESIYVTWSKSSSSRSSRQGAMLTNLDGARNLIAILPRIKLAKEDSETGQ